jgi:UDP-N-acetylmuramyl pentapeptide phosphotransferase/UDP-N-acetylglucosamine-1-phosphate transferase
MNMSTAFTQINWLAVIVATVAAFMVGFLWYSILFAKVWQKEIKMSDEEMKHANVPVIFGTAFFLNLIASIVLAMFLGRHAGWAFGLMASLMVAIAWIGTALGTNYLFTRKSLRLFFIDAGYFVVYYAVMGIILGIW